MGGIERDATLVRALLADLINFVALTEQAILLMIDGSRRRCARRSRTSSASMPSFIAPRHKERNVCDLLPERERETVRGRMRASLGAEQLGLTSSAFELLASELDRAGRTPPARSRGLRRRSR